MSNVFTHVSPVDQFIVSLYSVLTSFKTKLDGATILLLYTLQFTLFSIGTMMYIEGLWTTRVMA